MALFKREKKTIVIDKLFVNKNNHQVSLVLPRKKLKGKIPKKVEVTYW